MVRLNMVYSLLIIALSWAILFGAEPVWAAPYSYKHTSTTSTACVWVPSSSGGGIVSGTARTLSLVETGGGTTQMNVSVNPSGWNCPSKSVATGVRLNVSTSFAVKLEVKCCPMT
jgi:hypothetical protein